MARDTGGMKWLAPKWIGDGNHGEITGATLDNTDSADREMGMIHFWNFNLDAIAQFKVQQNDSSVLYEQGASTIPQIMTKTGTNEFHGSAFEFVRNNVFDAHCLLDGGPPTLQSSKFEGCLVGRRSKLPAGPHFYDLPCLYRAACSVSPCLQGGLFTQGDI